MFFSLHNKLTIKYSDKCYTFYNKLLPSILSKLAEFKNYNQFLSIGSGLPNESIQNTFHLSNYHTTLNLKQSSFQSDITKGETFGKYIYSIEKTNLNLNYISEIALSNNENDPIIYNYFSLISDDNPNGLDVSNAKEILFEITIFTSIIENTPFLLCSGPNPFIEFLVGNGIQDIFAFNGTNYSKSGRITREVSQNKQLFHCEKNSILQDNSLILNFSTTLIDGEINEIVFVTDNRVFARQNLKDYNPSINTSLVLKPHANYVIKLDDDVKNIHSITNQTTNTIETNYHISKYSNSFGDKIHPPFFNLFDSETSRFVSKDGKLLFFVLNDKVYAYINEDFDIKSLDSKSISENYITNIISFDKYIFIISKINPYITTYIINENKISKVNNDIQLFEQFQEIENINQIDITVSHNNKFMIGMITSTNNAITIYLDYDESNGFTVDNYLRNNKEFNYIIAMYKNNFCDAQIIYLREGETSASSRIVTHYPDLSENDIYSYLAFELTNNAKKIYSKGRAIISEKTTNPSVLIFYYPQVYEYELPLISTEIKNFISHDLNYIIQEHEEKVFNIYNLVGYETPEEFLTKIESITSSDKIIDFEFLSDSLLIFLDDEKDKIIAYNLNLNKSQIENLSDSNSEYLVNFDKYNKLNSNENTINFNLSTRINL